MNKLLKLSLYCLMVFSIGAITNGCKPQPPDVILIPEAPVQRDVIDNYYYVKFGWGVNRSTDTIVMEVPDDTLGTDTTDFTWNPARDFMQHTFDYRHEFMRDTFELEERLENNQYIFASGYSYAPATFFYNRGMFETFKAEGGSIESAYNGGGEDLNFPEILDFEGADPGNSIYFRDVFHLAFPIGIFNDTLPYWDIEDYVYNPSLKEGTVKWGRVGTDSLRISGDSVIAALNMNTVNGVVISYIDENQVEWRTDNYPNFQTDSYFQLNDIFLNQRDGESYWIIEGVFAANLYDEFGNAMKAKAGEFRMRIIDDVELGPQPE